MMGFEEMEPVFGQLKAEWCSAPQQTTPLEPFLFLAGPLPNNPSTLRIHVSDFHSNTWAAVKSHSQLEDMRDSIGIGGSWSEFVEYVVASIKSDDVKLVMEGESKSGGAAYAKLIAQKAKGMPRISVSLVKLVDVNASEAMANLSLELYKAYKNMHISLIKEETRCCQLTNRIAAEQAKSETLQKQLNSMLFSKKQKLQKMNDDTTSDGVLVTPSQDSPDKQAAQISASTKGTTRVVPAYRRAKVRGVFLQDSDDDDA
ncbi:uncharacterized protein LOC113777464 [Coffea eugenioides]|uniref:uncharacterized protein LOC113777464 n=1 Tax=Coffea eugenioides TaxID=49369 RepID=UPI000F60CA03|nr:uncharacterized protein LOC113777464 [Coffea eugenioides]XP_027178354.1 uncharacterized protein LOC113777464 [Coffea eugenioides]